MAYAAFIPAELRAAPAEAELTGYCSYPGLYFEG